VLPRYWYAALAVLFLVLLVATAPARLVRPFLPSGQVLLQGLQGSLWRGSASRALVATPAGYASLGALRWRLSPWSLLTLSPSLSVDSQWGSQTVNGRVRLRGPDSVDLSKMEINAAAGLLRQFLPVMVSGSVSLQLQQLSLREGLPVRGEGRAVWQNARWESPEGPVALGSYALEFEQPRGEALAGTVLTLSGPLRAEGSVALDGRRYDLDLVISSEQAIDQQLQQGLSLLAAPLEDGRYRLQLDGELQQ
jgi:general secretion pathway protein N